MTLPSVYTFYCTEKYYNVLGFKVKIKIFLLRFYFILELPSNFFLRLGNFIDIGLKNCLVSRKLSVEYMFVSQ